MRRWRRAAILCGGAASIVLFSRGAGAPGNSLLQWNLKQLETFVWVAKLGSFRRTAERLNTTQPNISVRIADLENALGVTLFERDAGSVTLTPTGAALLGYAERVLVATEEFSAKSGLAADQWGVVRLGVTETIVQTWLRAFLSALKGEYPNVAVELTVDVSANLQRELMERSLDIAFLNGPISDFNIDNIDLGVVPLRWVASPKLPGPLRTREDLARQTILTHARNTRPFVEISAHFREAATGTPRIVPSSSQMACLQMTIDALGIAALPLPIVREPLASGALVEIDYAWTPTPLGFTASYPHTPASGVIRRAALLAKEIASAAI